MKKLADKIRRVGLLANPEKLDCRAVVRQAAALVLRAGREPVLETATAGLVPVRAAATVSAAQLGRQVDLLLVFGGDGTMLRAARETAGTGTPVLGINTGGLGFLTATSSRCLPATLRRIWQGDFTLENRPLIEAERRRRGRSERLSALNDFVIGRGAMPRLIELQVEVDDTVLTRYRCDGLIVSSPTGSTAYSLAAGGAVVAPEARVFALTPICPHTLSNRSVIVSLDSEVQVRILTGRLETTLSADGQVQLQLAKGDRVIVRRSRRELRLVRLTGTSFFGTLRQKLRWSGSTV